MFFFFTSSSSIRRKMWPSGWAKKRNRCTGSRGAEAPSVTQPAFSCGPTSSRMTLKTATKWPSFYWIRRVHSIAKAPYATVPRYSLSAPWFHPFNATICSTTSKKTICSIWIYSPSMGDWRWRIRVKRRSSVCSLSCVIGVFHMKLNMVRSAAIVCYKDGLKCRQNKRPNYRRSANKSLHASPTFHVSWCHIRA